MVQRQGGTVIGMGSIKQRRLGLPVSCHQGTNVGEQGNRVKGSCGDEADEELIVPGCDFTL